MSAALDPQAEKVMRFIQATVIETGRAPTIEAIREACAFASKSRAHARVAELIEAGFLARDRYARGAAGLTILKCLPDRIEEAAKAVCEALGHTSPEDVATARDVLVSNLIQRSAA